MNYAELLKERTQATGSIACMGLDPILEKIPIEEPDTEKKLTQFFIDILDACISENAIPQIAKPNIAFYEQYGFEGLRALKKIIDYYHTHNIPILIDAKRGDIGKTSAAYANNIFNFWNADALTIAPYMGHDSVGPFIEYAKQGKGSYILCRTSNPGAVDLQDLKINSDPLYIKTAEKITEWSIESGVGAVVGATYPQELKQIASLFQDSKKEIPLLIPGVGTQGGSAKVVVETLKSTGYNIELASINSSSGINYAYEKQNTDDYAGAAAKALKQLKSEITL